ncbi:MAG: TIGR04002 family protein [Lachnospiraceae bacterium]|nr:TIGR04002 family protein [Lachnospiraceae bacterium]
MSTQIILKEKKGEQLEKAVTGTSKVKYITMTGIMAALITLMTAYICHIPIGVNGGYVHFGDSLIYLAAVVLPTPYALAAAAIGGGLADLLTAPMWMPATVIIKMLITIPFTNKSKKIVTPRNVIATVLAYLISGFGYFLAEYVLFGTWTVLLVSMSQSLIQSFGSAVFFIVLGMALDKAHVKARFFG